MDSDQRDVWLGIIAAALALLLAYYIVGGNAAGNHSLPATHTVEHGETLWSIAGQYWPTAHTGEMVYNLRQINGIDDPGTLQPGLVIRLEGDQ